MTTEQPQTIAQFLAAIQDISKKLEDHDIELEEAINLYSQGVALGKACQDKLNQAQEKIKVLTADSETLIDPEQLGSAADV